MSDARSFFSIATQFLRLAESAAELLVRQHNAHTVITELPITPRQYNRKTRWSDHAVGIAILFNFYHGLELVLKGCLSLYGPVPTTHRLTQLLKQLEAVASVAPLVSTLTSHIKQIDPGSPLGEFLSSNNISIDAWYQALKYPKSTTGQSFSHIKLKYGANRTVTYWKSLKTGGRAVRKQAVALIRQVEGAY